MNHKLLPLIVIEGADGAGTTTQARVLADKLSVGATCILTRQPSDGPIGRQIRDMLTGKVPPLSSQSAFQLMFTADRLDHAERVILPAAKDGSIIVSDRYDLSTAIYLAASEPRYRCPVEGCGWTGDEWPMHSGFAKNIATLAPTQAVHDHEPDDREAFLLKQAFAWNEMAPRPLVTIVLAVSAEVAAERRALRGGKAELFEQAAFQRRVCGLYSNAHSTYSRGNALEARSPEAGNARPYWLWSPVVTINGDASQDKVAEEVFACAKKALSELHQYRRMVVEARLGMTTR